jgi:hypothetical protein
MNPLKDESIDEVRALMIQSLPKGLSAGNQAFNTLGLGDSSD